MVRPSLALLARTRFSTKEVGFGFYRGNKTGSMGAHTEYGGYIIDWRKVRNYAVPDLKNFKLTPYVTREVNPKENDTTRPYDEFDEDSETAQKEDTTRDRTYELQRQMMPFLEKWRQSNPEEFRQFMEFQYNARMQEQEQAEEPKQE